VVYDLAPAMVLAIRSGNVRALPSDVTWVNVFQVSSLRRKEGGRYGADRPERHRPAVILAYYEAPSQLCGLVPDVTPALAVISGLIGALPKTALSLRRPYERVDRQSLAPPLATCHSVAATSGGRSPFAKHRMCRPTF
jgi:hypothetical protein